MRVNSDAITPAEFRLVKWQFRYAGFFENLMYNLMAAADDNNLAKLALAFPDDAEAYRRYAQESGYWTDVKKRAGIAEDL